MKGPCHFVVFGALGHLVTTRLLPALFHLELAGHFDEPLAFVAFARRDWNTRRWRTHINDTLVEHYGSELDVVAARRLAQRFEYVKGDHTDPGRLSAPARAHQHTTVGSLRECRIVSGHPTG